MTYTDSDVERQLAMLRYKNMMSLKHTVKNRHNSFKPTNDSTYIHSDQLLPFRNGSPRSVSNFNIVDTHQNWFDQNKYRDHWCHKYTDIPATPFSRSSGVLHSDADADYHCKMPLEPEVDERSLQQNRQNNACQCGACYDSHVPVSQATSNMPAYAECEEPKGDDDFPINCELKQVYEKIRRLADLKRHQSIQAGCYEPYLGITEGLECPSVLSPPTEPPHTRCLARVKPYKRHQMYQRMWKVQPAIGDNFRFTLRRKVRQKMLQKDEVQLPHKMFVPNLYVVPTVKPRYQLRWIVRKCNHDYKMPPCGVFHDV